MTQNSIELEDINAPFRDSLPWHKIFSTRALASVAHGGGRREPLQRPVMMDGFWHYAFLSSLMVPLKRMILSS
jgi:hypothetical protein